MADILGSGIPLDDEKRSLAFAMTQKDWPPEQVDWLVVRAERDEHPEKRHRHVVLAGWKKLLMAVVEEIPVAAAACADSEKIQMPAVVAFAHH